MNDLYALSLTVDPTGMVTGSLKGKQSLAGVGDEAERMEKRVKKAGVESGRAMDHLGEKLKHALGLIGITIGAVVIERQIHEAFELAVQYERMGRVVQTTGAYFGYTNKQLDEAQRALQEVSFTMNESRQTVQALLRARIDLASADKLGAVAQGITVQGTMHATEAMDLLTRAIVTGMDRGLKAQGVYLGIATATEQAQREAALLGRTATQQELQQARLNAVLANGTSTANAWRASLGTTKQVMVETHEALEDIRLMVGVAFSAASTDAIQGFYEWAHKVKEELSAHPEALVRVVAGLKGLGTTLVILIGAWVTYKGILAAVAIWHAAVVSIKFITMWVQLATAITSAADALVLMSFAGQALKGNLPAIAASVAVIAGAWVAYKAATKGAREEQEKIEAALGRVGKLGGAGRSYGPPGAFDESDDEEAASMRKQAIAQFAQMRATMPGVLSDLRAIARAWGQGGEAAAHEAERVADLNKSIAEHTKGLDKNQAAEVRRMLTAQSAGQKAVDNAKMLNSVQHRGSDEMMGLLQEEERLRTPAADALARVVIEQTKQNQLIEANRTLTGDALAQRKLDIDAIYAQANANQDLNQQIEKNTRMTGLMMEAQGQAIHRELELARAMEEPWKNFVENVQRSLGDLFSRGISSAQEFANIIKDIFRRLVGEIMAMWATQKFVIPLAGMLGIKVPGSKGSTSGNMLGGLGGQMLVGGLAAGGAGWMLGQGIGAATGSKVAGGLGGAAAGAVIGTAIMPGLGTAVGALTGFIGGLMGASKAAKEARERMDALRRSLALSMAEIRSEINGASTSLSRDLMANAAVFNDLRDQAKAAYPEMGYLGEMIAKVSGKESDRTRTLSELNALEAERAAQIKHEYELKNLDMQLDLEVRRQVALGHKEEAEDRALWLAQSRELTQARKDNADATTLAMIAEVQRLETIALMMDRLQAKVDQLNSVIAGLEDFRNTLLLAPVRGLSPEQQMAETKRQYEDILSKALGGDQDAAGRLPSAANALLEATRAVFGSTSGFQDVFDKVLSDTENVINVFKDQRSILEQQLAELVKLRENSDYEIQLNEVLLHPVGTDLPTVPPAGNSGGGTSGGTTEEVRRETQETFALMTGTLTEIDKKMEALITQNGAGIMATVDELSTVRQALDSVADETRKARYAVAPQ